MVSSLSSTNVLNSVLTTQTKNSKDDIAKLVKYTKGEALTQAPDTFAGNVKNTAGSTLLFEGVPILNMFKRNKKTKGSATKVLQNLDKNNSNALKNIFKGEGKLSERISNYFSTINDSKKSLDAVQSAIKTEVKTGNKMAKAALKADKAAEKLKAKPKSLIRKKANKKALAKLEKISEKHANAVNATQAIETTTKVASKVGKVGKFKQFMKSTGTGVMLVLSGISECLTEVIPTFKELGVKSGIKQTAKSAVKVVGDVAGFAVGQQVGMAAGTALGAKVGALVGSVVPGIGTAIGAVVGIACGTIGSWAMGKVTKAITGKTEREKATEAQQQNQAEQIVNNNQSLEEIKAAAMLKLQEEAAMNNGQLSDDGLVAYAALQNLENTNPFAAA